MNRQPGFSVIEFVISIMISAMLMTAALTIYQQISKGMVTIQRLTQQDIEVMIIKNRLSQDLIGLCPLWFSNNPPQSSTDSAKQDPKQPAQPQTTPITPENPSLQKSNFLYSQNENENLKYLTFVTTSTLQTYTNPQYECARVVYALTTDTKNSKLFLLQRKEEAKISSDFNKESILLGEFYTLAKNISKCIFEYGFIDTPLQERQEKLDQEWKLKWVDHWGTSDDKKQSTDYIPTMPDIVRVKITIQENPEMPGKEHEIYCLLTLSKELTFQSFAQKRKLEQQNAKATPVPPGQPTIQDAKQSIIAANSIQK